MLLHILRALFALLMAAVGWFFVNHRAQPFGEYTWLAMSATLTIAVFFICVDILSPRKKLAVFSGTFLGLIVGIAVAWGLSFVVRLLADQYLPRLDPQDISYRRLAEQQEAIVQFVNMVVGIVCVYLSISFILQTKDDFRFIIPYVEFTKQLRGARPFVVDTSAIIDGRLVDIAATGMIDSRLLVPRFVLDELQLVADSPDKLKRNRGRRGLDMLNKLQSTRKVETIIYDWHGAMDADSIDQKLLALTRELNGRLLTTDHNLTRVGQVRGVEMVNINELASALRPVVLPGEKLSLRLVRPGEEPSQGVGYLQDGTMVVVEQGRPHVNEEVEVVVTNVIQTSTGRLVFARLGAETPAHRHRGTERVEDRP